MPKENVYSSAVAQIGIGRQRGAGYYNRRVTNLLPILATNFVPRLSGSMSNYGIEVGGGTITEGPSQKEAFSPMCTFSGHVRVGGLMNLQAALGYKPIHYGTVAATPVDSTLTSAVTRNHRYIASAGTYAVGDLVQVGAPATPGVIAAGDNSEVHQVAAVQAAAINEVQVVTIYGSPTGGSFTLSYKGKETTPLAYNASAAAVAAALVALTTIGAGNVTVAGSAGGPYTVTAASALAGTSMEMLTGNGDNLTGGTGYGAEAGLPGQYRSFVDVQRTAEGTPANSYKLATALLFDHAAAEYVGKMDPNKPTTGGFYHIQPNDPLDNDGFSMYVKFSNGTQTYSLLYFDGKCSRFDLQFQQGSVATFSAEMKFGNVVSIDPNEVSFAQDIGGIGVNNTRGKYNYLGDTVNAPRSISFTNEAEIPDDFTLFEYKPQSVVHTGYSLKMTTEQKFVKALSDKINFNATNSTPAQATVSDIMPQYPLDFRFDSQTLIGTSQVPFSLEFAATDVQYGQMDPTLNTNQFASTNIGMINVIPVPQGERWIFIVTGLTTSDAFGAI